MKKFLIHHRSILHEIHHPHLKRRMIFEIMGLIILCILLWEERGTIGDAITTLRQGDLLFLSGAVAMYWIALPLGAIALRLVSQKNIPLFSTTLTHLAGSGPGRIIPGGLGTMSMVILHLKKAHLRITQKKAIAIVATQQLIATITNILLVVVILVFHDTFQEYTSTISHESSTLIAITVIVCAASLLLWLHHVRSIRDYLIPIEKQFKKQCIIVFSDMSLFFKTIGVSLLTIGANSLIIVLVSHSLGVPLPLWNAIIAMSSGVLTGGIVPTPGGVGAVEAGIATSLVLLGYDPSYAAGVAILFRVITYWLPLLPGTLAYIYLVDKKII